MIIYYKCTFFVEVIVFIYKNFTVSENVRMTDKVWPSLLAPDQ